ALEQGRHRNHSAVRQGGGVQVRTQANRVLRGGEGGAGKQPGQRVGQVVLYADEIRLTLRSPVSAPRRGCIGAENGTDHGRDVPAVARVHGKLAMNFVFVYAQLSGVGVDLNQL